MLNESVSNFPTPSAAWSDIARVCRRVCVLRERGLPEDAERVRSGELMALLSAVRAPGDTDASLSERLNALFAVESERVANAAVLAELLIPALAEKLGSRADALPLSRPGAEIAPAAASAPAFAPVIVKPHPPRPASIADFIDEMIAQEKPAPRSTAGPQRRAS